MNGGGGVVEGQSLGERGSGIQSVVLCAGASVCVCVCVYVCVCVRVCVCVCVTVCVT